MGAAIGDLVKIPIGRLAVGVVGVALVANGLRGIVVNSGDTHPLVWAKWLIGSALVHDLLLAPFIAVVGFLVSRFVPRFVRAPIQVGLLVSATVLIVGLTAILSTGGRHYRDNASLLPLPYARNLLIVLAAAWFAIAVAVVVKYRRRKG
jgi:hypothetical protein